MLRIHLDPTTRILEIEPDGKLEAKDFESVASVVDPVIEKSGSLAGVLVKAKSFPGWNDFEAFTTHMRFVRDHHKNVTRLAVVTDAKFGTLFQGLAKHFVKAELRSFPASGEAEARRWLSGA
jgi:hypothetical protein